MGRRGGEPAEGIAIVGPDSLEAILTWVTEGRSPPEMTSVDPAAAPPSKRSFLRGAGFPQAGQNLPPAGILAPHDMQ